MNKLGNKLGNMEVGVAGSNQNCLSEMPVRKPKSLEKGCFRVQMSKLTVLSEPFLHIASRGANNEDRIDGDPANIAGIFVHTDKKSVCRE